MLYNSFVYIYIYIYIYTSVDLSIKIDRVLKSCHQVIGHDVVRQHVCHVFGRVVCQVFCHVFCQCFVKSALSRISKLSMAYQDL